MSPPVHNENTEVERPFIEQLQGLGWTFLEGRTGGAEDADLGYALFGRESFREVLLVDRLRAALRRVNVDHGVARRRAHLHGGVGHRAARSPQAHRGQPEGHRPHARRHRRRGRRGPRPRLGHRALHRLAAPRAQRLPRGQSVPRGRARQGRQRDDTGLDPETQAPFLGILIESLGGESEVTAEKKAAMVEHVVHLVELAKVNHHKLVR